MAERTARERLELLVTKFKQLAKDASDGAHELQAILDSKPTIAADAKALLDAYVSLWERKYREKYVVVAAGRIINDLKKVLETLDLVEIRARLVRFLASADPYYAREKHPIGVFIANVNKFAAADGPFDLGAPAVDCKHIPRCANDTIHTRRVVAERKQRATQ